MTPSTCTTQHVTARGDRSSTCYLTRYSLANQSFPKFLSSEKNQYKLNTINKLQKHRINTLTVSFLTGTLFHRILTSYDIVVQLKLFIDWLRTIICYTNFSNVETITGFSNIALLYIFKQPTHCFTYNFWRENDINKCNGNVHGHLCTIYCHSFSVLFQRLVMHSHLK